MKLCDYGCGQEAKYFREKSAKLPNGRAMCAKSPNSCPAKRAKTKGDNNPSKRADVRKKISETNKVLFANGSEYREKCKATLQERYGTDNPMRINGVPDKIVNQRHKKRSYRSNEHMITPEAMRKKKKTRIKHGYDIPLDQLDDFKRYKQHVTRYTEQNYKQYREQINPKDLKRGRTKGTYQLDHILSKLDGFKQGILPEVLSHPANLRMMTIEKNISKSAESHYTVQELYEEIDKY